MNYGFTVDFKQHGGFGQHLATIKDPHTVETGLRDLMMNEITYIFVTAVIKVSFALSIWRIVRTCAWFMALGATIAVIMIALLVTDSIFVFACKPVAYSWQRALDPYTLAAASGSAPEGLKPLGKCLSPLVLVRIAYFHASVILAADTLLGIVFPAVLLHNLTMRRSLKLQVGALIAVGATPAVASAARIPYLHLLADPDIFYAVTPVYKWSFVELYFCFIATSITTFKPLVVKGLDRLKAYRGNGHGKYNAGAHDRQTPQVDGPPTTKSGDVELKSDYTGQAWSESSRTV